MRGQLHGVCIRSDGLSILPVLKCNVALVAPVLQLVQHRQLLPTHLLEGHHLRLRQPRSEALLHQFRPANRMPVRHIRAISLCVLDPVLLSLPLCELEEPHDCGNRGGVSESFGV